MIAHGFDADGLSRIVPGIHDHEAAFGRVNGTPVRALPDDQRVHATRGRLGKDGWIDAGTGANRPSVGPAGRWRFAANRASAVNIRKRIYPREQLSGRKVRGALHSACDATNTREGVVRVQTKTFRKESGVAKYRMRVQRKVRRIHGNVVLQQQADPFVVMPCQRDDTAPEESVVDNKEVGTGCRRAANRPLGRIDGRCNPRNRPLVRELQAVDRVRIVGNPMDVQERVQLSDNLGESNGHGGGDGVVVGDAAENVPARISP